MTDVYLIADCSGSFSDLGKRDLQKLLLHTARDMSGAEELTDFTIRTYLWRETVSEYKDGDKLVAKGRAELKALVDFIDNLPEHSRILLLSDGIFGDEAQRLKRVIVQKEDIFLTVGVGADADLENLRFISPNWVFDSAQIITALKTLCFTEVGS